MMLFVWKAPSFFLNQFSGSVSDVFRRVIVVLILCATIFFISGNTGVYQGVYQYDKYPFKMVPFKKNERLTNWVLSLNSGTKFFVNLKNKLFDVTQEFVDYQFYERSSKSYVKDISDILKVSPKASFFIIPYHSVFKLEKHSSNLPIPDSALNLVMAKNEWESFQLIILPNNADLKDVHITMDSENMDVFERVELHQNTFIPLLKPYYPTKHQDEISDPLIPLQIDLSGDGKVLAKNNYPFYVKKGDNGAVWVSLKSSSFCKPGCYKLKFEVECKLMGDEGTSTLNKQNVEVQVNILDFKLPTTLTFKTAFSTSPLRLRNSGYYQQLKPLNVIDSLFAKTLFDFHLNPCDLYRPFQYQVPTVKKWESHIKNGANVICLGRLEYFSKNNIVQNDILRSKLKKKVDSLRELALLQYAFIYIYDEVKVYQSSHFKELSDFVRSVDSSLKIAATTIQANEYIYNNVNVYVSQTSGYDSLLTHDALNNNKDVWWYTCVLPNDGNYANFFTDYPAISPRILFWQAYKYNVKGMLYWDAISFRNNVNVEKRLKWLNYPELNNQAIREDRWPNIPWVSYSYGTVNGDGQLFYPGKEMGDLWPSIRLINIRDGIEDYEYFVSINNMDEEGLTNDLSKRKMQWLMEFDQFIYDYKRYDDDPSALLHLKRQAGLILEQYYQLRKKRTSI